MQILVTSLHFPLVFSLQSMSSSVELLTEIVWLVRHVFSSWKERGNSFHLLFFCLSSILLSLQQDCCYVRKTFFSPSIPSVKVKGEKERRRKANFTSFNQFFRGWCSKEIDLNLLHTFNTRRDCKKSQRNRERRGRSNEDEWTGRDLELGLFLPIFFPKQSRVWQSYVTRIKTLSLGYCTFVFNWQARDRERDRERRKPWRNRVIKGEVAKEREIRGEIQGETKRSHTSLDISPCDSRKIRTETLEESACDWKSITGSEGHW